MSYSLPKNIISIIIPTFNEHENIIRLINHLLKIDFLYELEIIIVDDNSFDGTSSLVRKYAQKDRRIRLISRLGRSGLSSAIKEGCLCASGEVIAVMDADGQHDPLNIKSALEKLLSKKVDIIAGSRFSEGSKIKGLSKTREKSSSLANKLARWSLYGFYSNLTDYMSGFFIFKRKDCIQFIEKIDVNGFKFLYELLVISKGKLKTCEIPLVFEERIYGESKLDLPVIWDFLISLIHTFSKRVVPRRAISFALVGSIGVFVQLITIYLILGMVL